MTDQSQLPQINVDDLKTIIPKLRSSHDKALAVTQAVTQVESEEEYQEVEKLCARLKITYDEISYPLYRKMAEPVESILDQARDLISPFDYKSKKDNEYNRLRGFLTSFRQRELEKKKLVEAEAAKRKEKDNHIVDVKTSVLKRLSELITQKTKDAYIKSGEYFAATTIANFDEKAEQFMKMKPKLKPEDYEGCFEVKFNQELITVDDAREITAALHKQEPFEKWNDLLIVEATPVINTWRAKIPEIKQQLQELEAAKTDTEQRTKIELEQKRKAQAEELRNQQELDRIAKQKSRDLEAQADVDKMHNSFVEQGTLYNAGDPGPVKLVLKFDDPKKALKAFTTILYHVFSHPDFKGIIKTDAKGVQKVDEDGNPIYLDQIQYFINFFLSKCDAAVEGTTVFEKAKIIIKK